MECRTMLRRNSTIASTRISFGRLHTFTFLFASSRYPADYMHSTPFSSSFRYPADYMLSNSFSSSSRYPAYTSTRPHIRFFGVQDFTQRSALGGLGRTSYGFSGTAHTAEFGRFMAFDEPFDDLTAEYACPAVTQGIDDLTSSVEPDSDLHIDLF